MSGITFLCFRCGAELAIIFGNEAGVVPADVNSLWFYGGKVPAWQRVFFFLSENGNIFPVSFVILLVAFHRKCAILTSRLKRAPYEGKE